MEYEANGLLGCEYVPHQSLEVRCLVVGYTMVPVLLRNIVIKMTLFTLPLEASYSLNHRAELSGSASMLALTSGIWLRGEKGQREESLYNTATDSYVQVSCSFSEFLDGHWLQGILGKAEVGLPFSAAGKRKGDGIRYTHLARIAYAGIWFGCGICSWISTSLRVVMRPRS